MSSHKPFSFFCRAASRAATPVCSCHFFFQFGLDGVASGCLNAKSSVSALSLVLMRNSTHEKSLTKVRVVFEFSFNSKNMISISVIVVIKKSLPYFWPKRIRLYISPSSGDQTRLKRSQYVIVVFFVNHVCILVKASWHRHFKHLYCMSYNSMSQLLSDQSKCFWTFIVHNKRKKSWASHLFWLYRCQYLMDARYYMKMWLRNVLTLWT